ncbi:MAG: CNT family concentrative nucleoside transporter [Phycisphaerales bacterium]|jgi:CNT family concentrative nucleoside transporter
MNPIGILGVIVLIAIAWGMSENRKRMPWKLIIGALVLQIILAFLLIKFPPAVAVFDFIARGVNEVIKSADAGISFVFGSLGDPGGSWGFIFAFRALSIVVFFASLVAVLYHLGIMQRLIASLAWLLRKTLGVTGTEALAMSANVFVGQTEAPLCVKPFIAKMTRSQIMTLMVGGFATIAGSVLAAYVGILGGGDEEASIRFTKHLLTASVMSAPAAFVMAKIIVPETEEAIDEGLNQADIDSPHVNVLDAAADGASDGVKLALNIGGMLIAFVSLVALMNLPLNWLGGLLDSTPDGQGWETLSIETILGTLFTPLAWTMGVAWEDCTAFGSLLGEKIVLTEFIAYFHLGDIANTPIVEEAGVVISGPSLSPRSIAIATFALCGFANFASIAIQIGGLSTIAPTQREAFVTLGVKAMFGGAFASWMTASIAGMFL